jgi:hypothetical protein
MKKIIPMILLLSLSLPAFAREVKLICTLNDGTQEIWRFDDEKKTVSGYPVDVEQALTAKIVRVYFISDNELGFKDKLVQDGRVFKYARIMSRIDGSLSDGDNAKVGRCVPLKQAF